MEDPPDDDLRDGAGRRSPSHLDTIVDPKAGEWSASVYGLAHPPETFRRDRAQRDVQRARSRWEVRVAQFRAAPPPPTVDARLRQRARRWEHDRARRRRDGRNRTGDMIRPRGSDGLAPGSFGVREHRVPP